jgi:hypothetical protein
MTSRILFGWREASRPGSQQPQSWVANLIQYMYRVWHQHNLLIAEHKTSSAR